MGTERSGPFVYLDDGPVLPSCPRRGKVPRGRLSKRRHGALGLTVLVYGHGGLRGKDQSRRCHQACWNGEADRSGQANESRQDGRSRQGSRSGDSGMSGYGGMSKYGGRSGDGDMSWYGARSVRHTPDGPLRDGS